MLDPLKPALILPEVVDLKMEGRQTLVHRSGGALRCGSSTITGLLHINSDHVKPGN
jgi:hypothetical protein